MGIEWKPQWDWNLALMLEFVHEHFSWSSSKDFSILSTVNWLGLLKQIDRTFSIPIVWYGLFFIQLFSPSFVSPKWLFEILNILRLFKSLPLPIPWSYRRNRKTRALENPYSYISQENLDRKRSMTVNNVFRADGNSLEWGSTKTKTASMRQILSRINIWYRVSSHFIIQLLKFALIIAPPNITRRRR